MTQEQYEVKAKGIVKSVVDCISQGAFDKLSSVTLIDSSWCGDDGTQEDGIKTFAEWLKEQLECWSEDYGREFVVDPFDEECLDLDKLENGRAVPTYYPTSHGGQLDFWFEIYMRVDDNDDLISEFNINI